MLKSLLMALALMAPADKGIPITATESGIDGGDMADTLLSNAINMESGRVCNQLSVTLAVTAGTSTRLTLQCFEAGQGEGFQPIPFCESAASAACGPDIRTFTMSDYTAAGGVIWISSRWPVTKRWAKCQIDDPDDGTGTVIMTGVRSWQ
jgi:hypothetical protein